MKTAARVLLALLLIGPIAGAQLVPPPVHITFRIKPAAATPVDAKIFLSGDAAALGDWSAGGLEARRGGDGVYVAVASLARGRAIEFKVTRGSWETVEKNADGSEMPNRTVTPTQDATVELQVAAWADKGKSSAGAAAVTSPASQPARKSTLMGDIRVHAAFHSTNLNNDRRLLVYLPPNYDKEPDRRYSVLYMHDGQNLFDFATSTLAEWKADETAERLIRSDQIEPIIIVAIDNTPQRIDEYTLTRDAQRNQGGNGGAYVRFVADEVKPFIDKTYRTRADRAHTGVGGSSLGATISLELCLARPEMFGKCAVMSPALWWNDMDLLKRLKASDGKWAKGCRFWIDLGSAEAAPEQISFLQGTVRLLAKILADDGLKDGTDYRLELVPGAHHDENAWARRFDRVLLFLYPRSI